jgi:hypothetical protein
MEKCLFGHSMKYGLPFSVSAIGVRTPSPQQSLTAYKSKEAPNALPRLVLRPSVSAFVSSAPLISAQYSLMYAHPQILKLLYYIL